MRIGLMLRAYDEKGGISVYARNLVAELLLLEPAHDFVLFYRGEEHLGTHSGPRVIERALGEGNKQRWDQIAVPLACRRERVDVLLHPKFTVPVFAPCPSVMVVHGADWFVPEQAVFYNAMDVRYQRVVMPLLSSTLEENALSDCASNIN